MALDTRDRRASALFWNRGIGRVYPNPDGAIASQADRQQIALVYRGILAGLPIPNVPSFLFLWRVMSARPFYIPLCVIAYGDTASNNLPPETEAIYCGGAGILAIVDDNDNVVLHTVVAGEVLPVKAKRINSTSTTVSAGLCVAWK